MEGQQAATVRSMAKKYDADELGAELIKLNAFLAQQEDQAKAERARKKAERRREEAAERLKAVRADPKASADDKTAAEAAWKEAVAAIDGPPPGGDEPVSEETVGDEAQAEETHANDTPAEEAQSDDTPVKEAQSDDSRAEEAQAGAPGAT